MARSSLLNNPKAMFASPNEASVVFDVDGFSNARPKGLFYIRFKRPILSGGQNWREGHGFFAKAVDMPSITPLVEEINQYGRKRVIHTGIKYNPISLTFYDTVDGQALRLWAEYAKYYFGDFNHANQNAWSDDITGAYQDPDNTGFGFVPRKAPKATSTTPTPSAVDGINTQFFFDSLEIFQVYGGTFVQTTIVNPKISMFEPDGVDYEDMSPLNIRMSLTYEGIIYRNDGKPLALSSDAELQSAFNGKFSGEVLNPNLGINMMHPADLAGDRLDLSGNPFGNFLTSSFRGLLAGRPVTEVLGSNLKGIVTSQLGIPSSLSRYGNFTFGNAVTEVLSGAATGRTTSRSTNHGSSLFDTDEVLGSILGSSKNTTNSLSAAILGMANTFSDGTVQVGKRDPRSTT